MGATTQIFHAGFKDYTLAHAAKDFSESVKKHDGAKNLLEVVINVSDWSDYFGINQKIARATSETMGLISQAFSIMSLLDNLNKLRDQIRLWDVKDPVELKKDVFDHATLGMKDAANTAMFLNATGIYVLTDWMKSLKTVFWMALGVYDVVHLYNNYGVIKEYRAELEQVQEERYCEILNSKINLTYLQMVQSATLVAMAALSLVSIVFASMAHGALFNPVVMLGLNSAWITLHFVTYFYDKIIAHRENNLNLAANVEQLV